MKIMAVDIGGTAIKYGLVSENGEILQSGECPSEAKKGADHLIDIIKKIINDHSDYQMIGISTAGQVNPVKGYIAYASDNIPGYTGCQLKDILTKEFNVPVTVENDVNCAALGE
ncbi:MAG: ROK family protein, partial [Clostridia bacterium]